MIRSFPTCAALWLLGVVLCGAVPAPAQTQTPAEANTGSAAALADEQKIAAINARILANPRVAENYNELGVLYTRREDWPLAREAFIRAIQARPQNGEFHRNLGLVMLHLEDAGIAANEFEMYLKLDAETVGDGWRLLARAREMGGDVPGAHAALDDGLKALGPTPQAEVMRLVVTKGTLLKASGDDAGLRVLLEIYQPVGAELRRLAGEAGKPQASGVLEAESIEQTLVGLYLGNARALEASGRHSDAAAAYTRVWKLAPGRADILPGLIDTYLAAGDTAQARAIAAEACRERPESLSAWIATGKIAEIGGKPEEAIVAYRRAYDLYPQLPGLTATIGSLYLKTGHGAEGRTFLAAVIDDPATPPEVLFNYALSLMQEKDYPAAVTPLERVVRELPEFAAGWAAYGHALRGCERFADAVDPYQTSLVLAPDAKVAFNLGVCASRAGLGEEAIAAYELALLLDPSLPGASYNHALALMQAGRNEEAVAAFAAAAQLDPKNDRIFLNQGVGLHKLGRYQDAITTYGLALELKETPEAYDNLGLAYQALGDSTQAQSFYREAKKLRGGK
jgi:tetratricopeptide (TPR) repeat protein